MRKTFVAFCLPFFFLQSLSSLAQASLNTKRLDSCLNILYQQQLFNGVVLWGEKGQVKYKKAFGIADSRTQRPLVTASAFNLASVSKQFVGMLIMINYEEGKLKFDDPVNKYLPEFPYNNITLRHLLNHTSGMPEYFDWFEKRVSAGDTIVNQDVLNYLAANKPALLFTPGDRWQYCNTGYALLALVLEKVSGLPFEKLLQQKIVQPLHLEETYCFHYKSKSHIVTPNRVYGFTTRGGKKVFYDITTMDGIAGDGSIYSSVEDLYQWALALEANKLVKPSTMEQAYTPANLNDGSTYPYGFGWFVDDGGNKLSHTGSWVGFRNLILRKRKERQVLVILDNSDNPPGRRWIQDILDSIMKGAKPKLPEMQMIENVKLADGMGNPVKPSSVRIVNQWIRDTGTLRALRGEKRIDGKGLVLAPGFIDTHSHHDREMFDQPGMAAVVSQGVTTIVVGQDGSSEFPLENFWKKLDVHPVAVNVASYAGHNTIRDSVMGKDYKHFASAAQVDKMKQFLNQDLKAGALGFSTGLEYDPGIYSDTSEVQTLAGVAAGYQRRYISHIRSEDRFLENAIREVINIGARWNMPVQISHFKLGIVSQWKNAPYFLKLLDSARLAGINVTADVYPYEYWHSGLSVLLPARNLTDTQAIHFALTQVTTPDGLIISSCPSDSTMNGKTLAEIAAAKRMTPEKLMMQLLLTNEPLGGVGIIAKGMHPDDIAAILKWPESNLCSDGTAEGGHPRGWGSFTRVLGYYVREQKLLTLEEAIRKFTSLAADHVGIYGRGSNHTRLLCGSRIV
jgi:N-acyl-D-aspartate/D-glutamate deacylase/CubicO group peptidase (beta-lactamase class C family)